MKKQDTKHRIYLNVVLAGRVQKQNHKPMQGHKQMNVCLCIVSTAGFGYGHYNIKSVSPSKLANTTALKNKNCQHTLKNCSKLGLRKSYKHWQPARQSSSC